MVALANDGLRSLLRNIGSGDSLSAVRPESGRNDGDGWAFERPSFKKLEDVRPYVDKAGSPSSIHGAMSAFGASVGGGRFDTQGIDPFTTSGLPLS